MSAFVINPYAFGKKLLLDIEPAAAAYALRRLRQAYTGDCIRVRRSSDNTTQAIGFVGDDLDTALLESFCTGTNGFVDIWYDQSGSAYNLTQTNTSNQPQIVSSGSAITQSGKTTLDFPTNGLVQMPADGRGIYKNKSYGHFTFCGRNTQSTGLQQAGGFSINNEVGSARFYAAFGEATNNRLTSRTRRLDADSGSNITATSGSTNNFAHFACTINWGNATGEVLQNGSSVASGSAGSSGSTSNTDSAGGGVGRAIPAGNAIKNISEFVFYNTDVSASQSQRIDEQMAYYGL